MSTYEFGYWAIRGLAAPGRMIFAYGSVPVTDHQYGSPGTPSWFDEVKPGLKKKNPLINLPYVCTPCGRVVTQSNAVYRTIAEAAGVGPKTPEERELVDEVLEEVMDLRNGAVRLYYGGAQAPAEYLESVRNGSFTKLENWFAMKGTPFAVGAEPRTCDFPLFEMIDQHIKIFGVLPAVAKVQGLPFKLGEKPAAGAKSPTLPESTKELFAAYDAAAESVLPAARFPQLRAFHARFRALPQLKSYFDSASYRLASNGGTAVYDPMPKA